MLSGLTSSKAPINGVTLNGTTGPTAAQVLQAPPPVRKESVKESITRSVSPEEHQTKTQAVSTLGRSVPDVSPDGRSFSVGEPAHRE